MLAGILSPPLLNRIMHGVLPDGWQVPLLTPICHSFMPPLFLIAGKNVLFVRTLFILAQVAVANKNMDGARDNFQKAIETAKDAKVIGWSHVYLGRILDLKEEREAALVEYRAALTTGAELPEVKAAAERGLQQAYEPPAKPQ